MDVINFLLNILIPPLTFFILTHLLPPFRAFQSYLNSLTSFFPENIAGKVVLITGASSGIGEQIAYEYAERGAYLVLAARRVQSLNEVADRARQLGSPDVLVVPADVANVDDCRNIIDQTVDRFGQLDHLVNNAGILSVAMLEEIENISAFRYNMDVNFWGTFYMTRFAIPYLRITRGRVIVISSPTSWLPIPRISIYNASKAAVSQFFETLRVELGSDIGITIVYPGLVESEMTQGKSIGKDGYLRLDPELRDVIMSITPTATADSTARAIVKAVCRGEKYVIEPAWYKYTYMLNTLWPEVVEYSSRYFYFTGTGRLANDSLSKK